MRFVLALALLLIMSPSRAEATRLRAFISSVPPGSLYPYHNSDGITSNHLNQIFETLVMIDNQGNLTPVLAKSWKWVDPHTLEVKLREGVTFHNGEPFDSRAVKFTFDLFTDAKKKIKNRQYAESISSVEIVDSYTVLIRTHEEDSFLVDRLATVGHILPPEYFGKVGELEFSKHPIGTGPFQFKSSDFKTKMILEKNPNYWGGAPEIDTLEFDYLPNFETAVARLKKGELDFISHLPGAEVKSLMGIKGVAIRKKLTLQSLMVIVNSTKPGSPLRDRRFRKKLLDSLNFEDVVRYYGLGNGVVANSLSLQGESYFDSSIPTSTGGKRVNKIVPKNFENYRFRLQVTEPLARMGDILARQMRDLGMNVELVHGSNQDEVKELLDYKVNGQIPKIDFLVSLCAHLFPAFPHLVMLKSNGNWSMTADSTLDQMLEDVVGDFNSSSKELKFRKINRYVHDHALIFPGLQLKNIYAIRGNYDFEPHPTGYIYFKYLKKSNQK